MKLLPTKLRKTFSKPWYKSPLIYLPYIILIILQTINFLTIPKGHPHAATAASLGFITGILFMTFLHQQSKKSDEALEEFRRSTEQLDRKMWEAHTEARIKAYYANQAGKQAPAVSGPGDDLQEYL